MDLDLRTDPAKGVVVYPSLPFAGNAIGSDPLDPFMYALVAVDLPLSLLADTWLLPYDLTHPHLGRRVTVPSTRIYRPPPTTGRSTAD